MSESDRATIYAKAVVNLSIPAGPYVRGACQRHLNDLDHAHERGFYYDPHEASEAIDFFEQILYLNGGQYEGKPFLLIDWQDFVVGSIFGWKRKSNDKRRFRLVYVETPKGPLALDTRIPTPTGWTTMGEIKVGDYVFNSQSKPTIVTSVSPIFKGKDCYKLKFSDGSEIVADSEHEWYVSALRNGKRPGPRKDAKMGEREKLKTGHICKTYKMPPTLSAHPQAKWNYRINVAPALDLPDITLPIMPYTLGAWLGDGDSDAARITCADEEIITSIKQDGYLVGNKYYKEENKAFRQPIGIEDKNKCKRGHSIEKGKYCLVCARMTDYARRHGKSVPYSPPFSLNESLRFAGLFGNKHIPKIYFRAGTDQRMALLQGLMDTDGHVAKNGNCEITLCNKRLAEDVLMLLHTLGFKCAIRESAAKIKGVEVSRRWRITFQAYSSTPPVRLSRKLLNLGYEPKTKALSKGRMIVACDPVQSVPVRCITVESNDHMFLVGENFIPTCNSGKSPLCAGVLMKGFIADQEERAEIYACATHRDQAMIMFRDAVAFYQQSPELNKRLVPSGVGSMIWNLAHFESGSFFRVIASEDNQAGLRPHMFGADEIWQHKNGKVVENLRSGFKSREQPLGFMITNSGSDKTSICWEYHEMGVKVACEQLQNDEMFAYICSLDADDIVNDNFLENENCWEKVNPSLKYGLPGYEYMRGQIVEAKGLPSKMAIVQRLNFCIWTGAENPAISMEAWAGCEDKEFTEDMLAGRRCWGGLDLSAVNDLTAFSLLFEPYSDDQYWRLMVWFWVPGETLKQKEDQDHVPYTAWKKGGHLFASKGETISKTEVIKFIDEKNDKYNIVGIAYDRNRMKDLIEFAEKSGIELNIGKWDKDKKKWNFAQHSGVKLMPFGQESRSMTPAIDKFELMLLDKTFRHSGNPVLTWNAASAVMLEDEDGYRKISKRKSNGRVDGLVAAVMAFGIIEEKTKNSIYKGMTAEEIRKRMIGA